MEAYRDTKFLLLPDGDAGTSVTVSHLRDLVLQAQTSELAHAAVQSALLTTPEKHPGAEAAAIVGWLRQRFRYLADPVEAELVRDPRYLLRQIQREGVFFGDCDDASVLLATLLEAAGYPSRFIVQGQADEPYSHVLVEAELAGDWTAIDLTNRQASLGWKPSLGREARERGRGMRGLGWDEDSGVLGADMGQPEHFTTGPAVIEPGFFDNLFSAETLQGAVSLAERVGLWKPVAGYRSDGSPIYGTPAPPSTQAAAYSSLTMPVGGVPTWLWVFGGGLLLFAFATRPRPRR